MNAKHSYVLVTPVVYPQPAEIALTFELAKRVEYLERTIVRIDEVIGIIAEALYGQSWNITATGESSPDSVSDTGTSGGVR